VKGRRVACCKILPVTLTASLNYLQKTAVFHAAGYTNLTVLGLMSTPIPTVSNHGHQTNLNDFMARTETQTQTDKANLYSEIITQANTQADSDCD
jgi:cell division protein FtsB